MLTKIMSIHIYTDDTGSATAHPPAPPSRNSRNSTGSRHSVTSPGYASSICSYDIGKSTPVPL